jgi:hypothetical protein
VEKLWAFHNHEQLGTTVAVATSSHGKEGQYILSLTSSGTSNIKKSKNKKASQPSRQWPAGP